MVVRFVCVVCVPLCVRVSRVSRACPGSPRCLFTGRRCFRKQGFQGPCSVERAALGFSRVWVGSPCLQVE
jgi:hypothetical protein